MKQSEGQRRRWRPAYTWIAGIVAAVVVIGGIAAQFDPQAICESPDPRVKVRIWCKKELQPPFDQLVPPCQEISPPYTREGRVVRTDTLVKTAERRLLVGRALGTGGLMCDRKDATLWMRLLEFPEADDARLARRWLKEEGLKRQQLTAEWTTVWYRDGFPDGISPRHAPDEAWSYTYDDFTPLRDSDKTIYIEEGVYFRVGRWGGLYHIRRKDPLANPGVVPPYHQAGTRYYLEDDYFNELYRAIDATIPRLLAYEGTESS